MIDKKIANRLKRHGFDEWGIKLLTPIIKSLFKEYAMEIIGNDTGTIHNGLVGLTAGDEIRNALRAEQREKLTKEE